MYKHLITALFALVLALPLHAQLRYGFKTGLNISRLDGPSETDDKGNKLETWSNITGFHIGGTFTYPFSDRFGLRGELLYSKKGGKYRFEGPTYRFFTATNSQRILTKGTGRYLVNLSNSYFDIPIMAYARFGHFEISGGGYLALMVQSAGEGSLRYDGKSTLNGQAIGTQEYNLNYNYRKDDVGEGGGDKFKFNLDGKIIETDKTLGAYYDYPADKGNLYRSLDYGLTGGLKYYLSRALYFDLRLQYGLADLTNNSADVNNNKLDAQNNYIFNADRDLNFTIQASVGFGF